MNTKRMLIGLGKLGFCGLAYFIGLIIGGMVAGIWRLPQPPLPDGVTAGSAAIALLVVSPVLALGLAFIAPGLAGGWLTRTLILSGLTYVAYTLNTVLDASLYMTAYASTSAFSTLSAIFPSLFCGAAVAWLFPPQEKGRSLAAAWRAFFGRMTRGQWLGRLALAGLAFMPIYLFFGFLVNPFTGAYYRQNMFGLQAPGWEQILPVLLVRSLLFLLACLPVLVAWQKSERSLFLNLGAALFVLVGLVYMLISYWLPLSVRLPHAIEILADSVVYAGVLMWVLARRFPFFAPKGPTARGQRTPDEAASSSIVRPSS